MRGCDLTSPGSYLVMMSILLEPASKEMPPKSLYMNRLALQARFSCSFTLQSPWLIQTLICCPSYVPDSVPVGWATGAGPETGLRTSFQDGAEKCPSAAHFVQHNLIANTN